MTAFSLSRGHVRNPTLSDAPQVQAPLPRDLPSLTSLRAFAALAVFAFHLQLFGVLDVPMSGLGYTGVCFFFVLSGFVLTWSTSPTTRARRFYRRRFARVYPSHLATMLIWFAVVLVLGREAVTATMFGANLFLVQSWFWNQDVVFSMNGVAWSLSCEATFYACFPLLVRALRAMPGRWRWAIPGLWLVLAGLVATRGPDWSAYVYHLPLARMGEFVLGIVCALAIQEGWRPRIRMWHAVAVLGLVLLVVQYEESHDAAMSTGIINIALAAPYAAIIVAAVASDVNGWTRLLRHRALVYAGQVSFAFYLVHQMIMIELTDKHLVGPVGAFVNLGVSAAAAIALHHAIERPAQRRLTKGRGRDRAKELIG